MAGVRFHSIARFVVESRERYAQLQQKLRLGRMLMFDIERFTAGVLQAAHAQIAQPDYEQQQNGKAGNQREQGRVEPRLAQLVGLLSDPGSAAKDNFAVWRLDWV